MKSPFALVIAACGAALALGQVTVPTVRAQAVPAPAPPAYRLRLDWQKAERGPGGLVLRGRVTNTGRSALTYTRVTPLLLDGAGRTIYHGSGYLTAGPLRPGQSAEFRAFEPSAPAFARARVEFHEAGQPVFVQTAPHPVQAASR
jgi:hypothetical protein